MVLKGKSKSPARSWAMCFFSEKRVSGDTQMTRDPFDIGKSCKWPFDNLSDPFILLSDPLILLSDPLILQEWPFDISKIMALTRKWHGLTRTFEAKNLLGCATHENIVTSCEATQLPGFYVRCLETQLSIKTFWFPRVLLMVTAAMLLQLPIPN